MHELVISLCGAFVHMATKYTNERFKLCQVPGINENELAIDLLIVGSDAEAAQVCI